MFYGVALLTNSTADACTYDFGDTGAGWDGIEEPCAEAATDPHAPGRVPEATGFLVTTVPYMGVGVGFAF